MIIDIPTMFMMIIATSVTLTCSVGWVTRAKDEKELQLWTLGLALQTLVFTLFFLRNQIHDFFSVLVANAALSASLSCFLAAVVVFQQRRLSRLWFYAPPLLLATTFSFFMDDIGARIMICGAICSVQCLVVLITLLDRRVVVSGRGKYLIASGLSLSIAVLTLRPRSGTPWLEAEFTDGSGTLTLIWMGRRDIPGVTAGRELEVTGRVSWVDGRRRMYNPYYQLR